MAAQMEPNDIKLKYLISRLRPEEQDELSQLLGKRNTVSANDPDDDDLAQDALRGRIAMDRLPPRLHRQAMARIAPNRQAAAQGFAERFPGASHIRTER